MMIITDIDSLECKLLIECYMLLSGIATRHAACHASFASAAPSYACRAYMKLNSEVSLASSPKHEIEKTTYREHRAP
jgi:hypothetical protein